MNTKILAALAASALALSSCTFVSQVQNPSKIKGSFAETASITIDTPDTKLICGRVSGESSGVSLFGLIPLKQPSESTAVANMYQAARDRGCKLEGESVGFANTAVERSSKFYFLFTRPTLKVSGDLVQFVGNGHHAAKN